MDAVYMEAVQAITGSGGWPMSVFLTPDRRPFFGGTYFPPDDRPGTAGLPHRAGRPHRRLGQPAGRGRGAGRPSCRRAIASRSVIQRPDGAGSLFARSAGPPRPMRPDLLATALEELARRFDPRVGRVRRCAQVPPAHPGGPGPVHSLRGERGSDRATAPAQMATTTLDAMAAGGIHDHLGGGFARYSTDVEWLVPHFEKMLYDQAGLLRAFLHGWQVTGRRDYLDVVSTGSSTTSSRDLTTAAGRRVLGRGRRLRGGRGPVLRLVPGTDRRRRRRGDRPGADGGRRRRWPRRVTDWFGVTAGGNFEGSNILRRPVGAPLRRPRGGRGRAGSCSSMAPGPPGSGPGSTTRC